MLYENIVVQFTYFSEIYVAGFPNKIFSFCSYMRLPRNFVVADLIIITILGKAQNTKLLILCFSSACCYIFSARSSQSRTSLRVKQSFTHLLSTLNQFTI
jgi:hypothetical protein